MPSTMTSRESRGFTPGFDTSSGYGLGVPASPRATAFRVSGGRIACFRSYFSPHGGGCWKLGGCWWMLPGPLAQGKADPSCREREAQRDADLAAEAELSHLVREPLADVAELQCGRARGQRRSGRQVVHGPRCRNGRLGQEHDKPECQKCTAEDRYAPTPQNPSECHGSTVLHGGHENRDTLWRAERRR